MFFGDEMSLINIAWLVCLLLIVYVSIYFSFKLNFPQFKFIKMIKFLKKDNLNSFKLLLVVLGGRIGVGSIAGVSLAIYYGGIGSIFWMIVSVFFCATITFCETILGSYYKEKTNNGYIGGPSFYLKKGVKNNFLGKIYAILILICYIAFFIGIQSNTISKMLPEVSNILIGLILSTTTFIIIIGGLKKIALTSAFIVPIMTILYLIVGLVVAFNNFGKLSDVFLKILCNAFNFKSFFTGFIPCIIVGFQRGIFANEAGLGTGTMISSSGTNNLVEQGYIQMLGIYITTLIICLLTAIIVLTSNYEILGLSQINGIEITRHAFIYHFGNYGNGLLIVLIIMFSFSTITTVYYYGEVCLKYLNFKSKLSIILLKVFTALFVFLGTIISPNKLWGIVDCLIAVIIILNMYAIIKLKNKIILCVKKSK